MSLSLVSRLADSTSVAKHADCRSFMIHINATKCEALARG